MRDVHLHALFSPNSIAIVGTAGNAGSPARAVLSNLENWGYQGQIVSVNWTGAADGRQLPHPCPELAVLCLEPEETPGALEWLADAGVQAAIVISAGFREIGGRGYHLEERLTRLASSRNMTLLGPNCLGVASWGGNMNASLVSRLPGRGNIAFFSPSGSMCSAVLDWAASEEVGLSRFASLGNRAIIDEAAMLQFLADDPDTAVIMGYLEGMNSGRRFARISQTITREKPVIMLQAGLTEHGQKAISSHAGALTGSERAWQTALRQAGIIRTDSLASFFNLARMFGSQSPPAGPNLAIITNSGGAGILAADALSGTSINLARLGPETMSRLESCLPRYARAANPVDVDMSACPAQYAQALATVLEDRRVHMALVVAAPGVGLDISEVVHALAEGPRKTGKPVAVCLLGREGVAEEKRYLQARGLPCYANPKDALAAFDAMFGYAQWKSSPYPVEVSYRRDRAKAGQFLRDCLQAGKTELSGIEMQTLLQAYELQFPQAELARTSKSAVKIAKRLSGSVVLKVASPHIEYKSDVGGVELGLQSPEDVRRAFMLLTARVQRLRREAFISGCVVQEMVDGKFTEARVSVQRDPHFGPLISLSFPGDRAGMPHESLRLAPLSLEDAGGMMRELKFFSLSGRERGRAVLDARALEDVLLTASQMTLDFPEIYTLELDPVLVAQRGAWVAGARMTLLPHAD